MVPRPIYVLRQAGAGLKDFTGVPMAECLLQASIFSVERRRYPLVGGDPVVRDVVVHPGAVVILPRLTDGSVVMIRQYRHAVERELWELPAGTLEPPEEPADYARRELKEETGYRAGRIEPFGNFYTSPGILTERMWAFRADDLIPGDPSCEVDEKIKVEVVADATLRAMVLDGTIVDGKTLAVLGRYFLRD